MNGLIVSVPHTDGLTTCMPRYRGLAALHANNKWLHSSYTPFTKRAPNQHDTEQLFMQTAHRRKRNLQENRNTKQNTPTQGASTNTQQKATEQPAKDASSNSNATATAQVIYQTYTWRARRPACGGRRWPTKTRQNTTDKVEPSMTCPQGQPAKDASITQMRTATAQVT